ncbi:MAG: hypothetical protein M5U34_02225 [Chloroflexi bacterium]|nr:hypothetical protein [Chloroflexota bacterium]
MQLLMRATTQQKEADCQPLNPEQTLWRLKTQCYRLVYHQNTADKKLTLLTLAALEPQEAPTERDKFLQRFGHAPNKGKA